MRHPVLSDLPAPAAKNDRHAVVFAVDGDVQTIFSQISNGLIDQLIKLDNRVDLSARRVSVDPKTWAVLSTPFPCGREVSGSEMVMLANTQIDTLSVDPLQPASTCVIWKDQPEFQLTCQVWP